MATLRFVGHCGVSAEERYIIWNVSVLRIKLLYGCIVDYINKYLSSKLSWHLEYLLREKISSKYSCESLLNFLDYIRSTQYLR